jgi:acyl-CoA dehydrogenase
MQFEFSPTQENLRSEIEALCSQFDDHYWLKRDTEGGFPEEFYKEVAGHGWLGIAMPEAYGGAGLGITEAAILVQAAAERGAMSAASSIHMNIFGLQPVVVYGTHEQRQRMLPPLIEGKAKACFAVTEPTTGLNTTKLKTKAVRKGDTYYVSGQKVWISTAQVADYMLIITRTTPIEDVKRPTEGLTLFYTKLDRKYVDVREIPKMGRKAVDSNELFINELPVPVEDRVGEEGRGFEYLLHGLNPERILVSAEAIGIGRSALARASRYARERIVFDRPIGMNQGVQHPLARSWVELEAAQLLTFRAAQLYDDGKPCGPEANAAKLMAAESAFTACENAILTHGGFGYAKEYHVERLLREVMVLRIAPITPQLILSNIAEKKLGLPRSY